MTYGYAQISTDGQTVAAQVAALKPKAEVIDVRWTV